MHDNIFVNESRVESLKKRAKRCNCKFCGSKLEVRRIIFSDYEDARFEIFCPECDRIEYGVEPEIYQSAVYLVDTLKFNHYAELSQNEQTRKMNIAKVCEIMAWVCKTLGFLSADGFKAAVNMDQVLLGENLILTDSELEDLKKYSHER